MLVEYTGGDDEVVVANLGAVLENNDVALLVDGTHAGVSHSHVLRVTEDRAKWIGDVGRFEPGRRDLVKQW